MKLTRVRVEVNKTFLLFTWKETEDGIIEYVNKDMLIGDIIAKYPDAALVLMKCGMHCVSCGVSAYETLDQACAVHGLYTDDIMKVVNDFLTQTLAGEAAEPQWIIKK